VSLVPKYCSSPKYQEAGLLPYRTDLHWVLGLGGAGLGKQARRRWSDLPLGSRIRVMRLVGGFERRYLESIHAIFARGRKLVSSNKLESYYLVGVSIEECVEGRRESGEKEEGGGDLSWWKVKEEQFLTLE
jgi:hypothetical protein